MGPRDLPLATNEHARLRAFLQGKGLPPAQVNALVGAAPGSTTRKQNEMTLTAWLQSRPKGP